MGKVIVVGPMFAGKSTLVRELRDNYPTVAVKEIDEMIIEANGGVWPADGNVLSDLMARLTEETLNTEGEMVFVSSYVNPKYLERARLGGDKIVQFTASPEVLASRNKEGDGPRVAEMYRNLEYQNEIFDQGLVDLRISATTPTEEVARLVVGSI